MHFDSCMPFRSVNPLEPSLLPSPQIKWVLLGAPLSQRTTDVFETHTTRAQAQFFRQMPDMRELSVADQGSKQASEEEES